MKLTRAARKLLIACHPDRHGGDHSHMEQVFAVTTRSQSKDAARYCPHPGCGVRVSAGSVRGYCLTHYRAARRLMLASVLALCVTVLPAQLPPMPKALVVPAPKPQLLRIVNNDPRAVGNIIRSGPVRHAWTNGVRIATNQIPITPGVAYSITYVFADGTESWPAFWPSNAIYGKELQSSTNGSVWLTEGELGETKAPVQLLRIENKFKRWE